VTNPDHERPPEGDSLGGFVRRVLSPGPTAEGRLDELLADRWRELDEQASRLADAIADLEQREELLRDSRISVERTLRLGTSDLEAREAELGEFARGLAEQEARLSNAEAELTRRREELGAVELKRAALERREREVEAREERVAEAERRAAEAPAPAAGAAARPAELVFVPGPRYRLLELDGRPPSQGETLAIGDTEYVVVRLGPSPLPRDSRRCVYLMPAPAGGSAGEDSS